MSTMAMAQGRKKQAPLTYFLVAVFILFIGILAFCYNVTRHTTLIYLDEHGKPIAAGAEHAHH